MKDTLLIILLLTLLSCNYKHPIRNTVLETKNQLVENTTQGTDIDSLFWVFFEKFMWDNQFQKSRVIFPYKQNNKVISTSQDWNHLPFYRQKKYIPTLSSSISGSNKRDLETIQIEFSLIDFKRNISDNFYFKKINDKWFLFASDSASIENQTDFEFLEFLTEFSNDSIFQINHINFPFTEYYADSENDYENATRIIAVEDWKHLKLTHYLDQLLIFSHMEINSKFRQIFLSGVENGISIMYTFEKIDGEWTLTKLEDYST